jgi:hypothetical protein
MTADLETLESFNADWLKAWSDKDVERLLGFYAADTVYKDTQTAKGLTGHAELRPYLTQLFASTPPMIYVPDEVWAIENGFCGRWICDIGEAGALGKMRGFDLVILQGGKIALNEVYVHML